LKPAAVYTVKRSVPVRVETKMKSDMVGAVQIEQAVYVVGHHRKWVRIESIDVIKGTRISGWVVKKYLARL